MSEDEMDQGDHIVFQCSSASRKFLNRRRSRLGRAGAPFQCSSASRKFLNLATLVLPLWALPGFSALQRAENSSMRHSRTPYAPGAGFSALQRAENSSIGRGRYGRRSGVACFSALQRAENSSMQCRRSVSRWLFVVSVLFSEPKIPQ